MDATTQPRRAQDSCARLIEHNGRTYRYSGSGFGTKPPELPRCVELVSLPPAILERIDRAESLDARLVAFLEAHSLENPCRLSAAELASVFCPTSKPENGETEIRRAFRRIRRTQGERLRERRRYVGSRIKAQLAPARWIDGQGVGAYPGFSDRSVSKRSQEGLDLARARAAASRSKPPRIRAIPLALPPLPEELRACNEGAVWAALAAKLKPEELAEIEADLRADARYRGRPGEVELALRTLLERRPRVPRALFRGLFREACNGEGLVDRKAEAERATAAIEEAAKLDPWRYDPRDPSTHLPDWIPPPGEEPLPLIGRAIPPPPPRVLTFEEKRAALEARLRHEALAREKPVPSERGPSESAAYFLERAGLEAVVPRRQNDTS